MAVANGSVQLHTSPARGLLIINDYYDGETQTPERQWRLACTPEQIAGELSWVVGEYIRRALEASQNPRAATNDILKLWCKPTGAGTTCGGFVQADDGGAARVELIFQPGSDGKPVLDAVISLDKIRTRYAERQLRRRALSEQGFAVDAFSRGSGGVGGAPVALDGTIAGAVELVAPRGDLAARSA